MSNRGHCIECTEKLLSCDDDLNGEHNAECARCRAESEHDFDAEPNVRFDRFGQEIETPVMEIEKIDNSKNFERLHKAINQVLLLQRQTGLVAEQPKSESDSKFTVCLKTDRKVPVAALTFDWNDNIRQWILTDTTSQIEHINFLGLMG